MRVHDRTCVCIWEEEGAGRRKRKLLTESKCSNICAESSACCLYANALQKEVVVIAESGYARLRMVSI